MGGEIGGTFSWVLWRPCSCRKTPNLSQWKVKAATEKAVLKVEPEEEEGLNTRRWRKEWKTGRMEGRGESRQRIRNKDNLKFPEFFRLMLDLRLGWPFKETAWRFDKDNEMNRFAQDQDRMISFRKCPSMLKLPPNHNLYVRILCPLYFWPQETEDLPGRSLNY